METKLPTPAELGLPEKFDGWRDVQRQMIDDGVNSTKRFRGVAAPTGSGKSLYAVALGKIMGGRTVILTRTKGLQSQYDYEFSPSGLVTVMGKRNYQCDGGADDWHCERGSKARCMFAGTISCPYSQSSFKFLNADVGVTNYSYHIAAHKYGSGLGKVDHLILDEAHEAPAAIMDAMQIHLGDHEVTEILKVQWPRIADDTSEWKLWALGVWRVCDDMVKEWEAKVARPSPKTSWIDTLSHLTQLSRKLADMQMIRPEDWVVERNKDGYTLDPIRVGQFAERILFRHVPKVTFLSATVRPKTLWDCGVASEEMDFWEYPSPFDPRKSPIHYLPITKVDRNTSEEDMRELVRVFDQIQSMRRHMKGLVITPSYELRNTLYQRSKFSRTMLVNHKGDNVDTIVRQFKSSPPGTTLVSPSIGTGYDFPGREAEWCFIPKIPFPDRSKPVTLAREAVDKKYSAAYAAGIMEQNAGRHVRTETDMGETIIGDENMDWYYRYNYKLFSNWFQIRLKQVATIPPPIRRPDA